MKFPVDGKRLGRLEVALRSLGIIVRSTSTGSSGDSGGWMTESDLGRLEVAFISLGIIVRSTRLGRRGKRSGGFLASRASIFALFSLLFFDVF